MKSVVCLVLGMSAFFAHAQNAEQKMLDLTLRMPVETRTTLMPTYGTTKEIPDDEVEPPKEKRDVDILVLGVAKHHGSTPGKFNENTPGFGFRIATGTCFWDYLDCHVGAVYIAKNSVNGQMWVIGGGAKKDIFQAGPVTGLLGVETGLTVYEFPQQQKKTYYLPVLMPYVELTYAISKDVSLGVGTMWQPLGKGRDIEIPYLKLTWKKNFL